MLVALAWVLPDLCYFGPLQEEADFRVLHAATWTGPWGSALLFVLVHTPQTCAIGCYFRSWRLPVVAGLTHLLLAALFTGLAQASGLRAAASLHSGWNCFVVGAGISMLIALLIHHLRAWRSERRPIAIVGTPGAAVTT